MLSLQFRVDKSVLEDILAETNGKDASAYTAETYAVLTATVNEANVILENENDT